LLIEERLTMKTKRLLTMLGTAALSLCALTSVHAHGDVKCVVPVAEWKPMDDLQDKLKSEGWDIRKIKIDNGCYEVYGFDKKGKRRETYFNPKTFEIAGDIHQ